MVDALLWGGSEGDLVWVQIPSHAPKKTKPYFKDFFKYIHLFTHSYFIYIDKNIKTMVSWNYLIG